MQTTPISVPLNIAVLTISDTRTHETDTSGTYLKTALQDAGHSLQDHQIIVDNIYQLRYQVSQWIADHSIQVIITTGGTGFSSRDGTPEAINPLFDQAIDGFGELFRQLSYDEIGSSTVQSRALAGIANNTLIFCLPGSTNACKTGWEKILLHQLNSQHLPCNFANNM